MRFSVLNLLLLGTVLAAPIQDVAQTAERTRKDGLVSRGLVPILPRAIVVPKPVVPKPKPPVNGPDGLTSPKPPVNGPDAPGTAPDTPAPLRPNDPASPPKDTTPDHPGLVPNDDHKPPANKPDDANVPVRPGDDIDGPVNLPEACGLRKRCVGNPPPFEGAPASWKTEKNGKVVDYRANGYKTHKTLDEAIKGKVTKEPKFNGDLKDSGRYNVETGSTPKDFPDQAYIKDDRWADAFKKEEFSETKIFNTDDQIKAQTEWAKGDFKKALQKTGEPDFMLDVAMNDQDLTGNPMVRTLHNPKKGSLIVKASFNNEKDLYRPYEVTFGDNKYQRPAFGDKANEVGWTDQLMANHRKAAKDAGTDVKNLKYIAQDDITNHAGTREVIDGVYQAMGKQEGEMVTVRRTGGDAAETASFDALAGTVHAQRPIQMATDHHVELGNPTVDAIHVMKSGPDRYDMVVEFGRAPPATT